ncbi:hypothetical protein LF1_54750 [Rubripirellula obstinata]|uniref:Uncharacterized protein n=1 Tax=Rubripirellula obstinata TaxID=406547 RepID=A0A5B1C9X8_9BACT|nr:hypothetical protein [Rubripirellula obstinata]KAA1257326.1 hypothetical protein LF1_54750 [Rubripirellula obstinata]
MLNRRRIAYAFLAVFALLAGGFGFLYVALAPFAQRDADARAAFGPIASLQPEILDNAFGVYIVRFTPDSFLTDRNVSQLLSLNRIPNDSDLTLMIETQSVTDESVTVIRQLTSVDRLHLNRTSISADGIALLVSSLPDCTLSFSATDAADGG